LTKVLDRRWPPSQQGLRVGSRGFAGQRRDDFGCLRSDHWIEILQQRDQLARIVGTRVRGNGCQQRDAGVA
jgi:hypothetical protein